MWISLDLSSKTGYAIFTDEGKLEKYGQIIEKIEDYKADVKTYLDIPSTYPYNLMSAADRMINTVWKVIVDNNIKCAVVEHTESSKFRFSQRYLEWLHLVFCQKAKHHNFKFQYLLNCDWRRENKCYIKYWSEFQSYNKEVSKAKKKAIPTKSGAKIAKLDGKVVSAINQKKLSVILANKYFELNLEPKQDDISDALLLGRAAWELGLIKKML